MASWMTTSASSMAVTVDYAVWSSGSRLLSLSVKYPTNNSWFTTRSSSLDGTDKVENGRYHLTSSRSKSAFLSGTM